jgi:ribose 5-phosphate isomerase A
MRRVTPELDPYDRARDAAARAAVERISPGMNVGLGSGRAVWRVVERIADRWPNEVPLRAVCASSRTEELAKEAGIELVELDPTDPAGPLDLAIDGADEVDPDLGLIKGGGGAMLHEKLVIQAAARFVVVAETVKRVARLGETRPLPVEVVRFGWRQTWTRMVHLTAGATLRRNDDGSAFVTEEGHYILDCELPREGHIATLAATIKAETGVVEHGLFLGMADEVLLGTPDGGLETLSP